MLLSFTKHPKCKLFMKPITEFIISLGVILFFVVLMKISYELRNKKGDKLKPRYNSQSTDVPMGTGNGIGLVLYGNDFRHHSAITQDNNFISSEVKYLFFTIFYVPIIPLGCYRVGWGGFKRYSHKKSVTSYYVYGTERWVFWEVISIFCIPFLVGSTIWALCALCAMF